MKRSTHIAIITGAHFCRNPRVVKEARLLSEAGYRVSVIAPILDSTLKAEDDRLLLDTSVRRIVPINLAENGVRALASRTSRRAAAELTRYTGVQTYRSLGYSIPAAYKMAKRLRADYYIGHQEVGAIVAWKLMKAGYAIGADLEDWYSQDLLPAARRIRPIRLLGRIEHDLVRNARHVTTTSNAMADAMYAVYGRRPSVILNAFPWADRSRVDGCRKDRLSDGRPSLFWFSQTIGPGRGLDILCDALRQVTTPVQLHLRGNVSSSYKHHLTDRFPTSVGHTLHFHDTVPPDELLSRIMEHDIGMALEPAQPPSTNLTISNKILQYLLGGIAVIATPTAGQVEVAALSFGAVVLTDHQPLKLGEAIQNLVGHSQNLTHLKKQADLTAQKHFCWENSAGTLSDLVATAVAGREHSFRIKI